MIKYYYLAVLCLIFFPISATAQGAEITKPTVLVSVAPHKFFVEKIAGDTVSVNLMVPAGASSHTYEPTPKQTLNAGRGDIWFQIGEGFEPRTANALKSFNPNLELVDMRQGLDLIICNEGEEGYCKCCHQHSAVDPHFWLSARQAKIQAATMADVLSRRYPQHRALYSERLRQFQLELDALDHQIIDLLKSLTNRAIMVSHPAYAYFCRDYQLKQFSIEFEGKDPTPSQLTKILKQAREYQVRRVYIQMQYNNKGARLIAKEIGAEVITLDPYAENYMSSMLEIAKSFAAQK